MAIRTLSPNRFYVYILFRYDTGEPFYVGKGYGNRWTAHERKNSTDDNRHKKSIIRASLDAIGEVPKIKVREDLTETEAFDLEKLLIATLGRSHLGGPLVNLTDGGDGEFGRICSEENRKACGDRFRGKQISEDHKASIVAGMQTEESHLKMSAAQKRRFEDPVERQKIGSYQIGRKRSEATALLQKLNNPGHTGHPHTEEARAKMSLKLRGRPWSEARRKAQTDRNKASA